MRLAIFDFDGTIYPGETLPFLCKEWLRQKRSRTRFVQVMLSMIPMYLMYKLKSGSKEHMKKSALLGFLRLFRGEDEAHARRFFCDAYQEMKKKLDRQVLSEAKTLKESGFELVLVSGALLPLLDEAGKDLGFGRVIGTRLPVRCGRIDPDVDIDYINSERKVERLLEEYPADSTDLRGSHAYADSLSDLPLLELVGNPVAVNPEKRLYHVATERGWRIMK